MLRYRPIWLEIAQQQCADLTAHVRELVDRSIEQLLEDPTGHRDAVYNQRSDQWSVPLGDNGFLFYAVVREPPRVILLRLVTLR
jgi:hypothetical protein